jgi:hypothetical protein
MHNTCYHNWKLCTYNYYVQKENWYAIAIPIYIVDIVSEYNIICVLFKLYICINFNNDRVNNRFYVRTVEET